MSVSDASRWPVSLLWTGLIPRGEIGEPRTGWSAHRFRDAGGAMRYAQDKGIAASCWAHGRLLATFDPYRKEGVFWYV